jgi:hypothetical protein
LETRGKEEEKRNNVEKRRKKEEEGFEADSIQCDVSKLR